MYYMVEIHVTRPESIDDEKWAKMLIVEREYGQKLMRQGKFLHIWRVIGEASNVSIFDVSGHDELHEILSGLPLFRFLDLKVTAIGKHPSALPGMYRYPSLPDHN